MSTFYSLIRFIKIVADAGNIDVVLKKSEAADAAAAEKFAEAKKALAEAKKIANKTDSILEKIEAETKTFADERAAFEAERNAGLKDVQDQYEIVATLNAQTAETKSALEEALEEAHNKQVQLDELIARAKVNNAAAESLKAEYEARVEKLNTAIAG